MTPIIFILTLLIRIVLYTGIAYIFNWNAAIIVGILDILVRLDIVQGKIGK